MPRILQTQSLHLIQALTVRRQEKLRKHWNSVNSNDLAYVPREVLARGITAEEAREENIKFGTFARNYAASVLASLTTESVKNHRLKTNRKFVGTGYGQGYDSGSLESAAKAGLGTWWFDVSDVAYALATTDLQAQWEGIPPSVKGTCPGPVVKRAEIQSVLAEPESVALDIESVEVWYFCRLLGCLSVQSARKVLHELGLVTLSSGCNVDRTKAIVIINALRDHNPDTVSHSSTLWTKRSILKHVTAGAGCEIEVRWEKSHHYFDKTVSAMTLMSKG